LPSTFNPSGSDGAVPVELTIQDAEKSRLSYASVTFVNSSNPEQYAYAYFSSQDLSRIQGTQGDQFNYRGRWSSHPAGTGDWVIHSLWISDNAGNSSNYSRNYGAPIPQALSGVIFRTGSSFPIYTPPTDTVAPQITSITVTPTAVDLSTGRKTVNVRLQITDNVSGPQWGNITFQSGDFYEALSAGPFDLVSGSYTNGTYEVKLPVPTGTRNGQWSVSNLWIQERFPHIAKFAWQAGYGAFSVCTSNVETVRTYIANQPEHHATVSFQDEFRAFLEKHGVAFDERYVWD
jgi:hypothetical protein